MGKKSKNNGARNHYEITSVRKEELKKELQHLKGVVRKEVADKIKVARQQGDLSKNVAYDVAKEEQRTVERRIQEIEDILNNAKMISADIVLDVIVVGCKVKILDLEYGEYMDFQIVDASEADSLKNKVSDQSPLGKALLGKREGEPVSVSAGAGVINYKVINILEIGDKYIKNAIKKDSVNVVQGVSGNAGKVEIKNISPKSFITRVTVYSCSNDKHKLVDIRCRVKVMNRIGKIEEHIVPGAYCETCDKYFMLENEYQRLRLKGVLVCKVVEKDYWLTVGYQNGYMSLNKESLLHMLGYNVNAQADLSKMQRWGLLEVIVDEGIMTVTEIMSHLQWLINRSNSNRNFEDARFKWQMDYRHIATYESSKRPVVEVKEIKKVTYK